MLSILNNKVKFLASVQFLMAVLWYYLPPALQRGMSVLHLVHIVTDPLVFASTVYHGASLTYLALVAATVALTADVMGLILNWIAISRCVVELSQECVNRVVETNVLWFGAAVIFGITGFLLVQLLYRKTGVDADTATFNYARAARYVHIFMWTSDGILFAAEGPTIVSVVHSVVNPLAIWITYRAEDLPNGLRPMALLFVFIFMLDLIGWIIFDTSVYFSIQYLVTDLILVYYYFMSTRT